MLVAVVLMVVGVMVVVLYFSCYIFLATVSLFTHADIDECEGVGGEAVCSHTCFNTPGSFNCACPEGLSLGPNLTSCIGESRSLWFDSWMTGWYKLYGVIAEIIYKII